MKLNIYMFLKNILISIFSLCFVVYSSIHADTFGKTHFIIGLPPGKKFSTQATRSEKTSSINKVFISPRHNLEARLIELIDKEKASIKIAVYFFTSQAIADALIKASKRGVAVEVITDQSCTANKYECVSKLSSNGIPTYVYADKSALMHHKFAVFGNNEENKKIVWSGSFNFTRNANKRNQENALVSDHAHVIEVLDQEFNTLKKKCAPFGGAPRATTGVVAQAHQKKFEPFNNSWIRGKLGRIFTKLTRTL